MLVFLFVDSPACIGILLHVYISYIFPSLFFLQFYCFSLFCSIAHSSFIVWFITLLVEEGVLLTLVNAEEHLRSHFAQYMILNDQVDEFFLGYGNKGKYSYYVFKPHFKFVKCMIFRSCV